MPVADRNDSDVLHEKERDRDLDSDKDKDKNSKSKSSSKAKDLSHVPCKFFKVGSCTAGSSCPFSHASQEPGQQKDVCAWFVKGNCKFGHKCALAHILPGQSMAMDRKNKKAAQVAANANGGSTSQGREKGSRKRETPSGSAPGGLTSNVNGRNPLLSGSTAPTRAPSSRPPITMPLKATISPSAPAPPLKDTDFASFALPDETNKLPTAPAQSKTTVPADASSQAEHNHKDAAVAEVADSASNEAPSQSSPSPLPLSTPSAPRRLGMPAHRPSNLVDFGPIGSPPRSSPSIGQTSRINGFSPGTSPSAGAGFVSTSPFSAPGTQSVFLSYDKDESPSDFKARSGLAASLGAARTWKTDLGPVPSQVSSRADIGPVSGSRALGGEVALEDEDLEEFLPSSLTDLLTPEERSRRMSRTNSGQPGLSTGMLSTRDNSNSGQRSNAESSHRYSRSVPAPSLLGDIRSIWADASTGLPGSPDTGAGIHTLNSTVGLVSGTPTSFKSNAGFGGRSFGDDGHSPSLLSPSNASAAFLPGLHHHYLNSKAGMQQRSTTANIRGGPSSLHPSAMTAASTNQFSTTGYVPSGPNDAALSPPRMNAFGSRPPFETISSDPFFAPPPHQSSGRPIPGGPNGFGNEEERRNALSPSARALQAHAPGQSLPQGLAAGYSRIHALPPPPSIPSPVATSALGPSQTAMFTPNANGSDWTGVGQLENPSLLQAPGAPLASGLDAMFSRLSYSAAASRVPSNHSSGLPSPNAGNTQPPPVAPPGMVRNPSGRSWHNQGPLSPLSGPVVTGDDDDLFSMDG